MSEELVRIVQEINRLSPQERKNLVELGLKLTEEVGELAEAILHNGDSPGSAYKDLGPGKVLEEGADVLLVTMTLLFKAGYSQEEIAAELDRKVGKWTEKSLSPLE